MSLIDKLSYSCTNINSLEFTPVEKNRWRISYDINERGCAMCSEGVHHDETIDDLSILASVILVNEVV